MPKWVRDYLLLPATVGVVVAIFAFVLPKLFADKMELSYEIDGPVRVLDDPAVRQVEIEVNGTKVSDLLGLRVRLWNTGDKPIKDLPVSLVFRANAADFSILNSTHQTTPPYEFGRIEEVEAGPLTRRYRYGLLNPGDQDVITFLTTAASNLDLYAKAEGLKVIRREPSGEGRLVRLMPMIALVLGTIASFLSMILAALAAKLRRRLVKDLRGEDGS